MSVETNKQVVHRLLAAEDQGDFDAINDLFAPNLIGHVYSPPPARDLAGSAIKEELAQTRAAMVDLRHDVLLMVAEGDVVSVLIKVTGTFTTDWRGVAGAGKSINFPVVDIFRVADGQITELWVLGESLSAMMQLGIISLPASITR